MIKNKMVVKSRSNEGYISVDSEYEVITISISVNTDNKIEIGYYIIDDSNSLGFYESKKFNVLSIEIDNNWGLIKKQFSITLCPIEFIKVEDFWVRLSNFEEEAVDCFKKRFPDITIGI